MTGRSHGRPDPPPSAGVRTYPRRRSLRGARAAADPSIVQTPVPRFDPVAEPDMPPRAAAPRLVSRIIAVAAIAGCACVLAVAGLLPPGEAQAGGAVAASLGSQELLSASGMTPESAIAPVDAVLPAEPVDPGTLAAAGIAMNITESSTRYPFDAEVPLTDPFGYRTAPVAGFHDAQDMDAGAGAKILIVADGVITEAGFATDGCGFALTVQHRVDGSDVTSRYCHMQENSHDYRVGEAVQMGDPAGLVGNTGMSFGAHLHLAMRQNDVPIDPLPFLAAHAK